MNAEQNIRRLELILAAPFWQGDTGRCVMEKMTLEVTGSNGAYRWRMDDADDGTYANSNGSFVSPRAAKADLFLALEEGLRRHRERSASTH